MANSKNSILSGLFWSYGERITAQLVSLVVTIVLARLIAPEEYGVIALVTVFISIANTFVSDGFGAALVQKPGADNLDFSTVLYFGVGLSVVLYLVLFATAPLIAGYYVMPVLTLVVRLMALRLPVAAINSVQHAYISKRMEFKKFFFSTLFGTIVSAVVGIGMAFLGFGVWALVGQYLTNSLIDTIVLLFTTGWRPVLQFSFERLKPLVAFGWKILAVALMTTLYTNIRNLIIGKRYSSAELAYNNKGQQFPSLISTNINATISSVIFPAISAQQGDMGRVLAMTRKSIKVGTYLMAPLLLGMAALGEPIVRILLTEKWLPCVPYLQIMCMVYLLQPIQTASIQAMKALGKSTTYLRLEVLKKVGGLLILFLSIVCCDGVIYIVFSSLLAEIFSAVVNFPANKKLLGYRYSEQILDVAKPLAAAVVMCGAVLLLGSVLGDGIINLFIQIVVGAVVYLLLSVLFKIDSLGYLLTVVKSHHH